MNGIFKKLEMYLMRLIGTPDVSANTEKETSDLHELVDSINLYKVERKSITVLLNPYRNRQTKVHLTYLTPKTDKAFEVVIAYSNSKYTFIEAFDLLEDGISFCKSLTQHELNRGIYGIINHHGIMIHCEIGMGKMVKVIDGELCTDSDCRINIYLRDRLDNIATIIHPFSIDEVPIIKYHNKFTQVVVNGYKGWIYSDVNQRKLDLAFVPLNEVTNPSYYMNKDGMLIHYISQDIESRTEDGENIMIGGSPPYLSLNQKYYSYDGIYFYKSLLALIKDTKEGHQKSAINNENPFYNYYQYIPFRSYSKFTAEELNIFIEDCIRGNNKINSMFKGIGKYLIEAQNEYGVNALLMLSTAIHETDWGTRYFGANNIFNIDVIDRNFGSEKNYINVKSCIYDFAKSYISLQYCNPKHELYYGPNLGNKKFGINMKFAADPYWGERVAELVFFIDYYLSGERIYQLIEYDNNNNTAIYTERNSVYEERNDNKLLYKLSNIPESNTVTVSNNSGVISEEQIEEDLLDRHEGSINRPISLLKEYDGFFDLNSRAYSKQTGLKFTNLKLKDPKVMNVMAEIDALPKIVTIEDKINIEAVRILYEDLSKKQKEYVVNKKKLEDIEGKIFELEKPVFVTLQSITGNKLQNECFINEDIRVVIEGENVKSKSVTLNGEIYEWSEIFTIDGIYVITVTDFTGVRTVLLFTIDKIKPKAPTVITSDLNSENVKGRTEGFATVVVMEGEIEIGRGSASSNGHFNILFSKKVEGTMFEVYAIDRAKNISDATCVTIHENPLASLFVENISTNSMKVKGKSEVYERVTIYSGNRLLGKGTVDNQGFFSISITRQIKGTKLTVVASDDYGNKIKIEKTVI